ncbi:MAG: hypothetical protein JRG91_04965, partial [Deltaproteobacteria bacterium]|nr:hypothetical protein [Deltaproteobacteria bacterium]
PLVHEDGRGGELHHLEHDFAAVMTPGLHLAFSDRQKIALSGQTVLGEKAAREIWVCGAGAFVILKALAFRSRGHPKDAFDLYYVIRNYGSGPEEVAVHVDSLLADPFTREGIQILREDFVEGDVGPSRVSRFVSGESMDDVVSDVAGFVRRFLDFLDV